MHNDNRDQNSQTDMSKSQSAQQPQGSEAQDTTQRDTSDQTKPQDTGQADYGSAEQADTLTQNRTDVEGASLGEEQTDQSSGGFVGSEGRKDTSAELIEDDETRAPDGQ